MEENLKTYQFEQTYCYSEIRPNRIDVLNQFCNNRIPMILTDPLTHSRIEQGILDRTPFVPEEVVRRADKLGRFNIEVVLGPKYGGMIVISFKNREAYEKFVSSRGSKNVWSFAYDNTYHLLFRLTGGKIKTQSTEEYEIKSSGNMAAPSYITETGEIYTWNCPASFDLPEITLSELKNLLPKIDLVNGNQSGLRERFIKNEKLAAAIYSFFLGKWNGRNGIGRLRVLIALINRADDENTFKFRATDREVSLLGGMARATYRKHIKWLIEQGYIRKVKGDDEFIKQSYYELNMEMFPTIEFDPSKFSIIIKLLPILNSDTFSHGGLNSSGAQLYGLLLLCGPMSKNDLYKISGRGKSTINKTVTALSKAGFIEIKDQLLCAKLVSSQKMNETAFQYGVDGRYLKRQTKINHERSAYCGAKWKFLYQERHRFSENRCR